MRIVSTALHERYGGIIKATSAAFDQFFIWQPNVKPVFDLLEEFRPHMLMCDVSFVSPTVVRALQEYDTKIVLFGERVPEGLHPSVVCAEPQLSTLMKKHLMNAGVEVLYLQDYADTVTYWAEEPDDRFACDVSYYSRSNMEQSPIEKIQLFAEISQYSKLKMVGPVRMPLPQFLGQIKETQVASFWKASKIAIDVEATDILNLAANGVFALCDTSNQLYPTLDIENLEDQVTSFLKNDKARGKMARKARRSILESDTGYHRLKDILTISQVEEEHLETIDQKIEELKTCVQE